MKCDGKEISYDQLNLQANRLAHGLIRSGIGLEDPVAMLMSNCIEFPMTDIAIALRQPYWQDAARAIH